MRPDKRHQDFGLYFCLGFFDFSVEKFKLSFNFTKGPVDIVRFMVRPAMAFGGEAQLHNFDKFIYRLGMISAGFAAHFFNSSYSLLTVWLELN